MLIDLYRTFDEPLSHETLFRWHQSICKSRDDMRVKGGYHSHSEPMQVVSGAIYARKVHFEAPPPSRVSFEMDRFLDWFNDSQTLTPLIRAGIAHLYFVSIQPFEDGNGRISRALAKKPLAQSIHHPSIITLSGTIQKDRKEYYYALEQANKKNEITDWLIYFAQIIL